jgi:hypothetical protein
MTLVKDDVRYVIHPSLQKLTAKTNHFKEVRKLKLKEVLR